MNPKIRCYILAMVFVATGLNFLDRQVLSMTIIKIQDELSISDVQYGWVNTGFLVRCLFWSGFLLDPVFYFLMFWVPKYLNQERDLSFERIGELFWIPFLALGLSNILGGWCSDKLVAKNFSINAARKWVMGFAAALTLVAPFISRVSTLEVAIFLMPLMMLAHGFWITNYITAIADVFGKYATSSVVGLSGTAGAISGMMINPLIGWIAQNYSFRAFFSARISFCCEERCCFPFPGKLPAPSDLNFLVHLRTKSSPIPNSLPITVLDLPLKCNSTAIFLKAWSNVLLPLLLIVPNLRKELNLVSTQM